MAVKRMEHLMRQLEEQVTSVEKSVNVRADQTLK